MYDVLKATRYSMNTVVVAPGRSILPVSCIRSFSRTGFGKPSMLNFVIPPTRVVDETFSSDDWYLRSWNPPVLDFVYSGGRVATAEARVSMSPQVSPGSWM